MRYYLTVTALVCALLPGGSAFSPQARPTMDRPPLLDRQAFGRQLLGGALLAFWPKIARADVSDGTSLPQGAQQFQKVLRIRADIPVSSF